MAELKVFNRWSTTGINVADPGIRDYINLNPIIVPRTGSRNIGVNFRRKNIFIVERFMNKLFAPGHKSKKHLISSGHTTGKSETVYKIMEQTLDTVEKRTKLNPVAVLVKAIENASPREEIIAIEYGGARYPKAVEVSPQRRIDMAMRFMTQGAYQKSFNSKKSIVDALTDEIIAAFNQSNQSAAIAKKLELERQADSSR